MLRPTVSCMGSANPQAIKGIIIRISSLSESGLKREIKKSHKGNKTLFIRRAACIVC